MQSIKSFHDVWVQNVTGEIKYLKGLQVDEVTTGQLKVTSWNGKDVKTMLDQVVVKSDGEQLVSAKKTFTGDLNIRGNLQVEGISI